MATELETTETGTSQPKKLPDNFKKELWAKYAKQQKRKIKTNTTPNATFGIPLDDFVSFSEHLKSSKRILALLGAGLSASSGVPTFRSAGGFWRTYDCMELATPKAFSNNPSFVWQFYNYRRHNALKAKPNRAHYALAELGKRKDGFLAISQNIDGLCERAQHPPKNLQRIHGSLFEIRCTNPDCGYAEQNFTDPIVPALALPEEHDISDENIPLRDVALKDLPHCPKCRDHLLRPDVVWFGESLPTAALERTNDWLAGREVDLMLVIGTSALVWPAAGYIHTARSKGARVAVVNMEATEWGEDATRLRDGDWFFKGDAGVVLPEILKEVIGSVPDREDASSESAEEALRKGMAGLELRSLGVG